MMNLGQVERAHPRRGLRLWLAAAAACSLVVCAQSPPAAAPAASNASPAAAQPASSAPATATAAPAATPAPQPDFRAVFDLDGPWRFEIGDEPGWSDPGFDESNWRTVKLSQALADQGIESYSGYAWYRLRLDAQQLTELTRLSANSAPDLLLTGRPLAQFAVYINGVEAGRTRGMTEHPSMYESLPVKVSLAGMSGPIELAIRTWGSSETDLHAGLLDKVEVGSENDIAGRLEMATAEQWNRFATAAIVVTFLFICIAGLGAALYLAQRHHSEYLWLALLCLSVAAGGAAYALFGLGRMGLSAYQIYTTFSGHIFMAVTIEFVLRFSGSKPHRAVRIVQACVLLLPLFYFFHMGRVYDVLSVTAEVVFCATVCVLLFRAWRVGQGDAGIMLVPFLLAATADSADTVMSYFASLHWLPERFASTIYHVGPVEFRTGTVAYLVFLGSIMAVILYRFIGVSQVEQRSNAEIAAARSVQALLIPTQLPSNRNFMLESAYLPVNGVGGDFFQVLPLQDESLLIVVGDVSGKGLQAAMNSSTLVGALRNELSHDPATVLNHLNRVLLGAVPTPGKVPELDAAPCFATCLCARIYPDGTLTVANAGHLGPYRDGRELELLPGLPLGVIADARYEQTTHQLNRGDRLVFLSDGVVEAQNADGELFGFERTQQVSNEPARFIAQTAKHFGQTDDITVVSLYVASKTAEHAVIENNHPKRN